MPDSNIVSLPRRKSKDLQGAKLSSAAVTDVEQPEQRADDPDSQPIEVSAPALDFEGFLEEVGACSKDYHEVEAVFRRCHQHGVTDGRLAYVIAILHKRTDLPVSTLREISNAILNTIDDKICSTPQAAADYYVDRLKKNYADVIYDEGAIFVYEAVPQGALAEGVQGFYYRVSDEELRLDVQDTLSGISLLKTERGAREVERHIKAKLARKGHLAEPRPGLSFDNGFATWSDEEGVLKLLRHSPKAKARFRVPLRFSRSAPAPVFQAGLERVLPDPAARDALQEFVGCILFGRLPEKENVRRMMILVGATRSGKSTLIDVLQMLFPPSAVASVPPEDWSSEFERARLSGAALNVCTELKGGKLP